MVKNIIKGIILTIIFIFITGFNISNSQIRNVSAESVNTCLNRVNVPMIDIHWVTVPESAEELYTEEEYFFLAGQLIENNVVDAGDCPSGGLMLNGYANACGMAKAKETVVAVQNLLNEPILQAYEDVGVPPVLLKQLISYESQYWPAKHTEYHYGFGHITNIGLRNALQWNANLRTKVCPGSTATCASSISTADQILSSLIDTCETCEYGIDIDEAKESVDILAEVLLGFCYQTARLVYNTTGWHSSLTVDYATIWKLTLMNYNSGSVCVYNTLNSAFDYTQGPINWSDITAHVSGERCLRGLNYANQITAKYFDFSPADY